MNGVAEDRPPSYFNRPDGGRLAFHKTPAKSPGKGPGMVFLGGFHSDMTGLKAQAMERFAIERGLAFLRFDYRGHGQSSGDFDKHVTGDWIDDAKRIFDAETEGPQIVVGSSMGGWIAVHVAMTYPDRVAGMVGIASAPDYTQDLLDNRLPEAVLKEIMEKGVWIRPSDYDWEGYPITRALLADGKKHLVLTKTPIPVACPVRLLHGTADVDVAWQRSAMLLERLASDDATLTLIKDGDHRLSDDASLERLYKTVSELL
ncbi:MAG: alpha/beta fold hydrolase [Alphaproteobacteria bacterium]|nr:alpha/beta fold hydrolase [Alphaproteobacteria bacterium]